MTKTIARIVLAALALLAVACNNSTSSGVVTPTSTTTDVLTGTVAAPINGVLQSDFKTFIVGQSNGSVSVTLTSAVETLPGGVLLPTVTMGLAVGTFANGVCSLIASSFTTAQGGSTPQVNGTANAGTYCVIVSDVTGQLGPVAYAVAVTHA